MKSLPEISDKTVETNPLLAKIYELLSRITSDSHPASRIQRQTFRKIYRNIAPFTDLICTKRQAAHWKGLSAVRRAGWECSGRAWNFFSLNFELRKYFYFQVVVAERFLSIIPSLGHLLLDSWNPAGRHPHKKVSDAGRKIWIQPEIKIILGVAWAWLLATVQEGIPSALADRDQRKTNERVSFIIIAA